MTKYDLTTKEGKEVALKFIDNLAIFNPVLFLGKKAFDAIFDDKDIKKQEEVAKALIIEGRKSGVEEMEIKLNSNKGLDLRVPIENADVKAKVGSDNSVIIKVKYKN